MRGDFSNGSNRAGKTEGVFLAAVSGWQKKNEISIGLGGLQKKEDE